jgi:glycerate 2-kinase
MTHIPETPKSRALAAALYRAAVEGAAPFPHTREAVRAWFATNVDANTNERIHIVALGKAASSMTAGALDAMAENGRTVTSGVVVSSHLPTPSELGRTRVLPAVIDVRVGDHPVPGPASAEAADAIDNAVRRVGPGDLVLVLLSGGTTALTAAPLPRFAQQVGDVGKAQAHIANFAQTLLDSGLAIHEMNALRRRVLRWGAGRLAVALHARGAARIAVFAISDVIGDAPEVIGSGPCSAEPLDDTTFLALLDAHELRDSLERDMALFLGLQGNAKAPEVPSPDDPAFDRVSYTFVARNRDALAALADAARNAGIANVFIEDTPLTGEAAELGDDLARHALELAASLPRHERALWIAGGEPVVHLRGIVERALAADDADGTPDEPMKGGRMQALALAAALRLEERALDTDDYAWRITVLAAGTDGRDGPTDAAGAIVDCATPLNARRSGRRRPERDLATGRSWFSLDAAGDLLRTGPSGTNVMDVVALLIEAR